MRTLRGAIDLPITITVGIVSTVAMAFVGYSTLVDIGHNEDIKDVNQTITENVQRITRNEVNIERIPYLEAKIDSLLEKNNIDPKKVLPASVISAPSPEIVEELQTEMPQ